MYSSFNTRSTFSGLAAIALLALSLLTVNQISEAAERQPDFAEWAAFGYEAYTDQTFLSVNNQDLQADVYEPVNMTKATPVLLFFHGGGWAYNNRHSALLRLLPFLEKGFAVVNVDYRRIQQAPAPAAVIDARCALNWVRTNAKQFHFDINRIVVSGNSAGGHLALMTAFATDSGNFDRLCWDGPGPHVAAVVNWYGISDVADLLEGDHIHAYAVQWINDTEDPKALAKRVSPLTYINAKVPPVLSIHGDADKVVPYSQATHLHEELKKLGVINTLITIPGKGHGDFTPQEVARVYDGIWKFLGERKLMPDQK